MSKECSDMIDLLVQQRHRLGMTQKELARSACLTQSVIARLESKRTIPQLDTLSKVAGALGCRLALVPAGE